MEEPLSSQPLSAGASQPSPKRSELQAHHPPSAAPAFSADLPPANSPPGRQGHRDSFTDGLALGGLLALLLICSLTISFPFPPILDLATGATRFLAAILPGRDLSLLEVLTTLIWRLLWGIPTLIAYFVGGLLLSRRDNDVRQTMMTALWGTLWYLLLEVPLTMVINLIWGGIQHFSADMIVSLISEGVFSPSMATRLVVDALIALTLGIRIFTLAARLGRPRPALPPRL